MADRHSKRVACIIPPFYRLIESKNNRISPAMHYIAEILYRRGHAVTLINGDYAPDDHDYTERYSMTMNSWLMQERCIRGHESFDRVINELESFQPEYVFIGVGDVLMPTVELGSTQSCAYLAKEIKKRWGDAVTCIGYGHLLKHAKPKDMEDLNAVIVGEGEDLAISVVEEGARGALPVKWVQQLNDLPILTDSYLAQKSNPEDWDYIMSMRGCPKRCTFCYQPSLRGSNVSFMSPERFVSEIRYRIEHLHVFGFYFSDMIFLPGLGKRTSEMLRLLIELKEEYPAFHWWAEARVDICVRQNILDQMKQSGCVHLKFGVEMANQKMLDTVRKGIRLDEVKEAFRMAAKAGIKRTAYILLGCPGFTDQDYKEMLPFFKALEADNYVININVPYVGTQLYEQVKEQLFDFGIYKDGEESYMHTSLVMQEFWGISDETRDCFFALQGEKDDAKVRNYKRKIVEKESFIENNVLTFQE
ncbi:B12-binding domain-containing radical SAM protein [Paenibacillus sp. CN-4]|uniref:B12-binding domain-containing radical SAM protein n=1 Tax=Paenibacillus nanchangensis TaxID=3348343 RepID=UPI00397C93B1